MYNLGELVTNASILAQRQGDSSYATNFPIWINMGQMYAANKYDFWNELKAVYNFTSASAQETYYFPSNFDKPTRIFDLTNNLKPTMISREQYFDANISTISNQQTGTPQYAMIYGQSAVNVVPSNPFTVQIKSSSIQDNANPTCFIEGWLDPAMTIIGSTTITINSSTPTTYVPDPNAVSFYGITNFSKSADTVGFLSLASSSGTLLATIAPTNRESRYPILYLGLIPAGSYNYQVLYKKKINKLVNNDDYAFADMDDFLTTYAASYAYSQEKETADRAAQMLTEAEKLLDMAILNEMNKFGTSYQAKFTNQTAQSHRC